MPLSLKAFTQVMQSLPEGVSQDQINSAAKAAEEGTPLEHLWATINRPLVGSADALVPQLRHEHGPDESGLRKTAEDFGASLTSPASLGTMAAGVGAAKAGAAGLLGISKAARVAEAGLQAPLAAEGVRNLIDGETPGEKLAGGAQALLAGAGVRNAATHAFDPSAVVKTYMEEKGLQPRVREPYDPVKAMKTSDDYVAMAHEPNNPAVKASYDALKLQIDDQHKFLAERAGVKMEPWTQPGQPYTNSAEMQADIAKNNHLYFFPTEDGYGEGAQANDHPMLDKDAKGVVVNDKFRAVHDYFGHASEGNQFGPKGEQAAYNAHKDTLTEGAHGALTTETKGQNSFVNSGPHMRDENGALLQKGDPRFLPPQARPFAEQKAGLLPEYQPRGAADAVSTPSSAPNVGAPGSPAAQSPQLSLSDELAALINQSHEKGGSTTSLTGGKLLGMEDGKYMLSPYHDRQLILDHPPAAQDLRDYAQKNSDLLSQPGHNLGTWNNPEDGKHYLDVSITENDLNKATELARQHKQLAIYDMVNGQDITIPETPRSNEQVFGERAKQALVDGPVNTLDKLHSIGVPGAAEDAARIRNENPGRNIASTAMSVAAPAAASQIDDSDPNDPNYNLKHYGKLALDIGGAIGLGNTAIMAAKRATELPLHKNAAARGAGLMLLSTPKREWVKTIAEMGVEPKDMPKIRAASEKLLATQAAKAESKLTSTKQLLEFLDGGKGEGADWYNTQKELEHYFGKDAPIMANLIAATSNNSTVKSNLTLALKAYAQHKADPEAPIEGLMKTLLPAVQKSLAGEELNGRKVHAFSKALLGDPDAVVVDRWMMRAFGFKGDVPTASQYDVIEHAIKDMAKKQGITPREAQAQLWFGVKGKAEAGKGRAPSPPYGSILQQKFGPTQPQDVESTLVDAQARWKQKPKKGFTSALQSAILGKKDVLPLD
jgi:hypothetical protein